MRRYTQLTQEQRYQIEALKKAGLTQTEIAEQMGVHKSTISREIRRNRGQRGYRASQAHRFSRARHHRPGVRIQTEAWQKVETYLREDWSPEQISGYLREQEGIRISHEWIYQYVYKDKKAGGDLHRHLARRSIVSAMAAERAAGGRSRAEWASNSVQRLWHNVHDWETGRSIPSSGKPPKPLSW